MKQSSRIPFNRSYIDQNDHKLVLDMLKNSPLEGGGEFNHKCESFIEKKFKIPKCLTTASCTAALEMMPLVLDLKAGDEIIMPSYTFVTSASSFVLRGCVPVFVDIKLDDLNIDESKIEAAITSRTKAILMMHYGGVACNFSSIKKIAKKHGLIILEDAAQAIGSKYRDKFLGSLGDLASYSFHGTKNITCGEGGAYLINKISLLKKSLKVYEKGTNRYDFLRSKVNKYTWGELGSSNILSNFASSLLFSQLKKSVFITNDRIKTWNKYFSYLSKHHFNNNLFRLSNVPNYASHNAHLFFMIFYSKKVMNTFREKMQNRGIQCSPHYTPLHLSPFGKQNSKVIGELKNTKLATENLIRLPIWPGINSDLVISSINDVFKEL